MIFNQPIKRENINIYKKLDYQNDFTFIPIKYEKAEIIIQTPKLFIPFNISSSLYKGKKYIDLSFQNIKYDKNVELLLNNLQILYEKIKTNFNCEVSPFLKEFNNNIFMRFKVLDNTLFFDQNKRKIQSIENLTYGTFIIHLHGLWMIKDKITFEWVILQGKINMPIYLSEYSFIDDDDKKGKGKGKGKNVIPPPPPLSNGFTHLLKLGISEDAINHKLKMQKTRINALDLQNITLRKTNMVIKEAQKDELLEELKSKIKFRHKKI